MKQLTPEDFLNNELKGAHQFYDETGIILITGIEHSEICRIIEDFTKHFIENAISDDSLDEHGESKEEIFFENWMIENKYEYHNIPIEELLQQYEKEVKQQLINKL